MSSRIIYPAASTQSGSNNFTLSTTPLFDFADAIASLADNQYILLRSWYYNAPTSAAHDFSLWQVPAAAATEASTWGVLTKSTGVTYVSSTCPTEILKTAAGATWVLLALTASGKDQAGSVTISYSVETR